MVRKANLVLISIGVLSLGFIQFACNLYKPPTACNHSSRSHRSGSNHSISQYRTPLYPGGRLRAAGY